MAVNLIPEIAASRNEMQIWRRELHRNPETAFAEFETAEFVDQKLHEFGIEVKRGYAKTGVVGTLRVGESDRSIGLRADLDALDLQELNDFEHKSQTDGKMHACGHDGHIAMLLGAAQYLSRHPNFKGTVRFIFQPAEEMGNGGLAMVKDGLFEDCPVDSVYGLHNRPGLEAGKFATNAGTLLASMDKFEIIITGLGGHGAFPSLANNPISPACNIVSSLNEFVGSQFSPDENLVLSVCQFNGGDAINVIPQTTILKGTVRSLNAEAQNKLEKNMLRIVNGICDAYDVDGDVNYMKDYPLLVNSPEESKNALRAAIKVVGEDNVDPNTAPFMASDDFSWFLRDNPGNFIFLGNGVGNEGGCSVHNPNYDFNDEVLPIGANYWVNLVGECLGGK